MWTSSVSSEASARASACPNSIPVVHRVEALGEGLPELAVDGEAVGNAEELLVQLAEPVLGDGRLDARAAGAVELAGSGRGRIRVVARLDLPAELVVGSLE
jgi:hypothetical protein